MSLFVSYTNPQTNKYKSSTIQVGSTTAVFELKMQVSFEFEIDLDALVLTVVVRCSPFLPPPSMAGPPDRLR